MRFSTPLAILFCILIALGVYLFLPESCPEAARRCAAILTIAALFWAFELAPPFVTSLCVVLLLVYLLAKPGDVLGFDTKGYTVFLVPFASPVIMLFFGGFMLAKALKKQGADQWIAERMLSRFGTHPYGVLLGLMTTTAMLSMWISNTAASAIMLGLVQPLLSTKTGSSRFAKGLVLAIPFSANLGGIGTPIGTPPNAIAIGLLSNYHISIPFVAWMGICVPLLILLVLLTSLLLYFLYPSENGHYQLFGEERHRLSLGGKKVLAVGLLTICLFVTAPIHGIPEALTALTCGGLLTLLGLLDREDIRNLNWDILILMWGGLALGVGVGRSGLGSWITQEFFAGFGGGSLIFLFSLLALSLSLFISNTAAATLLLPIALDIPGENRVLLAVMVSLSCSVAMIFPVSTPPNAIAYSTGLISNREMIGTGFLVTVFSFAMLFVAYDWIIPMFLRMANV